jgi:hypothetical protein
MPVSLHVLAAAIVSAYSGFGSLIVLTGSLILSMTLHVLANLHQARAVEKP